ncbi:MAG: glycosyltransferase [Deltaproteobacteria bacterium]|nr:glycosyltransferase [Deltaproteobacteria bacterium]
MTTTFPRRDNDPVPARFVLDLCVALRDEFDVTVLAPHDPDAAFAETLEGVGVRRFAYFVPRSAQFLCDGRGILPNIRTGPLGKAQAPALVLAQRFAVARLLRERRFDLVHSHWLVPSGWNTATVARRARVPHIHTLHSSDLHLLRRVPGGRGIVERILASTHALFVVSSYLKKLLEELVRRPVEATVLPMGVWAPKEASAAEHVPSAKLLYVGKLIEVKGVTHFLHAMPHVIARVPNATLDVVGGGDLSVPLQREARELGIGHAVRFHGALPNKALAPFYAEADAVVVPSIVTPRGETEGMPVVILEALASGCPVVASNVGSLSDAIADGVNGFLANPADPADLADKIVQVLTHADPAALRRAARASGLRYDWKQIAGAYARVYRSLLAGGQGAISSP